MTPDSAETRLRELEREVSALRQKADNLEEDVRAFAPLLAAQAETRATLLHFGTDLATIQRQLGQLEQRLSDEIEQRKKEAENDRRDRERGQEERQRQDGTNRTLLVVAAIGLFGTFLLAIAAVVAAVVG